MLDRKFFAPIILLAVIILSAALYKFIYEPAQREILNMELETRRLREVEREIADLKARHGNLAAFVTEKELQLDEAQNFLPATLEQEKFIDELYRTTELHGVKIASIRSGEVVSSEEFQSQVVSMNLEADYISLLNFIREVLDGDRLTTLEEISLESSGGKIVSCDVDFKIFATAR